MSHVDEGTLHAYLDGELEKVEPGASGQVEDHLAHCSICRVRMSDAQTLRLRARDVLGTGRRDEPPIPAFDEVAARAAGRSALPSLRAAGHRRTLHRRAVALGWAASLLVALSAGWFAREARFRLEGPEHFAARELQSVGPVRPQPAADEAGAVRPGPSDDDAPGVPEGREPGSLSVEQFAELYRSLPDPEGLRADPATALEPLDRWSRDNPELARAVPAEPILRWIRREVRQPEPGESG